MYLFDLAHPIRDGAMENDIPIHEYQHGIRCVSTRLQNVKTTTHKLCSNRLTGGAGNAECLEDDISAGLDEGWSDAIAVFINRQKHHTRHDPVIIGEFVANGEGIRSRPFSTDLKVNELTCMVYLPVFIILFH